MPLFANFVRGRESALAALEEAHVNAKGCGSDHPSTTYYLRRAEVLAQLALGEALVGLGRALSESTPSDGNATDQSDTLGAH